MKMKVLLMLFCYMSVDAMDIREDEARISKEDSRYAYFRLLPKGIAAAYLANLRYAMVEQYIKKGMDINIRSFDSKTILMHAVSNRDAKMVTLLLDYGADSNLQDDQGNTALIYADTDRIAAILIENKADLSIRDRKGRTALMSQILLARNTYSSDNAAIMRIISADPNLNSQDQDGYTALMHNLNGRMWVMESLLQAGADPNIKNNAGDSLLILAAKNSASGFLNVIQLLSQYSVDIDLQNNDGLTVLMELIGDSYHDWCRLENINALIDRKPDFYLKNNKGQTALDIAEERGDQAVIARLKDAMGILRGMSKIAQSVISISSWRRQHAEFDQADV